MFIFLMRDLKNVHMNIHFFIKIGDGGKLLIICLYVDDFIFTKNDNVIFEKFKKSIMIEFDMSDLEKMHYFLSIKVVQSAAKNFVS